MNISFNKREVQKTDIPPACEEPEKGNSIIYSIKAFFPLPYMLSFKFFFHNEKHKKRRKKKPSDGMDGFETGTGGR